MLTLGRQGAVEYSREEARHVVTGYAFAEMELPWKAPLGLAAQGDPPRATRKRRWAYRTYDCVLPAPGPLQDWELSVGAGLDARVDSATLGGLTAIRPEVDELLTAIPDEQTFWDLPGEHLDDTPTDSHLGRLLRARWLLWGVQGFGLTGVHKLLHHKRPRLVPLMDRLTLPLLHGDRWSWAQVYDDLRNHREAFAELEEWFASRVRARGVPPDVALSRLRMHDILVWCDAAGQREFAVEAGKDLAA